MNTKFTPEQFAKLTGDANVETELKKWLRSISVEERIEFIKKLWPLNYRFALSLVCTSQLSTEDVSNLLKDWLILGQHNAAKGLIEALEPVLGEKRFWKIVSEIELNDAMRDFLKYYGQGKFGESENG